MKREITIANVTRSYVERETPDTFTPLGPLYIVSVLEQHNYHVDFRDYLVQKDGRYDRINMTNMNNMIDPTAPESIFSFLKDSADILGISCVGSMLPSILLALKRLKRECPNKTIILGGIGVSGAAEDILQEFPFIDIIVRGEGDETIVELMDHICNHKNLAHVKGISYREKDESSEKGKKGRVRSNPSRPRIRNIDVLPIPAYASIDFSNYSVTSLVTSRGCPYACSFCDVSPFWGRINRKRSIANVIAEMELLNRNYGRTRIELVDDTFTLDKKRTLAFCKALETKKLGITWSCFSRVDTIDVEMMEVMARSGCVLIFYGLESGSAQILKKINKQITREQAREVVFNSKKYFDVMASLMWGFPFESMEDFQETLDFFKCISEKTSTTYLFSLNPFPLSRLYRRYGDAIEFTESWGTAMGGLQKKELLDLVKRYPRIFPGFYHYIQEGFWEKHEILQKAGLINTFMSCFELQSN